MRPGLPGNASGMSLSLLLQRVLVVPFDVRQQAIQFISGEAIPIALDAIDCFHPVTAGLREGRSRSSASSLPRDLAVWC
jgi:hypothetical protein